MLIKPATAESKPSIELTPIIDMVFLLLIFFLVATTFAQEERDQTVNLPVTSSSNSRDTVGKRYSPPPMPSSTPVSAMSMTSRDCGPSPT